MKSLKNYIQEKLVIKKNKATNYKYFPETKEELREIIENRIKEEGSKVNLNDIDVSNITYMSDLFEDFSLSDFSGDISTWDISNVTNMSSMFVECVVFNQDISNWDVSKVKNSENVFSNCPIEEKYKPKFL